MQETCKVRVLVGGASPCEVPLDGPLELGRRDKDEPEPYRSVPAKGQDPARLIIAPHETAKISRHHALLEPLPSGRVRVTNRSKVAMACAEAPDGILAAGAAAELMPPFSLALPGRTISVVSATASDAPGLHSLSEQTIGPVSHGDLSARLRTLPALSAPQLDEVIGWLQTTVGVVQAAVSSTEFLKRAAEALVQIVGLHAGRVLLLRGNEWEVAAAHGTEGQKWQPSRQMLDRVRADKKTYWHLSPEPDSANTPKSLVFLQSAVAAPILGIDGNVIGALYGERRKDGTSHVSGKLEAVLVELLAGGVATGLARQAQEEAAVEARTRLKQFFGPELACLLETHPDLLEGREADITVLFCDVRGFSRVSEALKSPARTVAWISDVMRELSRRVLDETGVLVDFIGDEMLAMWGAPTEQPDQATRAVRAALAMLDALPLIDQRWQSAIGEPTRIGIGINSGLAQVGNTGSDYKFKYGPLGNTVNLGSRVQGLTKYLKCPLLVSAATRRQLGKEFVARRVVKTRVVNIKEPVDLYEVERAGSEERRAFLQGSEEALDSLEASDFAHAARKVGELLADRRGDGPLLLILSRASTALVQDGQGFDPVWEPPGK